MRGKPKLPDQSKDLNDLDLHEEKTLNTKGKHKIKVIKVINGFLYVISKENSISSTFVPHNSSKNA